jgi:hypothetical protein
MVERRGAYMRERDHIVNQGVDRAIILKCIFCKCDWLWIGLISE